MGMLGLENIMGGPQLIGKDLKSSTSGEITIEVERFK